MFKYGIAQIIVCVKFFHWGQEIHSGSQVWLWGVHDGETPLKRHLLPSFVASKTNNNRTIVQQREQG
jgi:hypothetical protein